MCLIFIGFISLVFRGCDERKPCETMSASTDVIIHDILRPGISGEALRVKYDTLIPMLDGWFITADSFDLPAYVSYMKRLNPGKKIVPETPDELLFFNKGWDLNTKKWGVVDSSGRVIVPFICDAVREYEKGKGIFSIYEGSLPLNTGLPRYNYSGYYFFFDRNGLSDKPGKLFKVTTIFVGDFHRPEWVIQNGNGFYLPRPYHQRGKNSRGALSNEYPPGGQ